MGRAFFGTPKGFFSAIPVVYGRFRGGSRAEGRPLPIGFFLPGRFPLRVQEEGGNRVWPGQGERDTGRDGSEKAKALSAGSCIPINWLMLSKATQGQPQGDGVAPWGDIIGRAKLNPSALRRGVGGAFPSAPAFTMGRPPRRTAKRPSKGPGL